DGPRVARAPVGPRCPRSAEHQAGRGSMTPAELRQRLWSVGLHTVLATAMSSGSSTDALTAIRARAHPRLAVLLDLLALQRAVPVDAVVPHLGEDGLALLEQRALVQRI